MEQVDIDKDVEEANQLLKGLDLAEAHRLLDEIRVPSGLLATRISYVLVRLDYAETKLKRAKRDVRRMRKANG